MKTRKQEKQVETNILLEQNKYTELRCYTTVRNVLPVLSVSLEVIFRPNNRTSVAQGLF